jgi:hypothetical protein
MARRREREGRTLWQSHLFLHLAKEAGVLWKDEEAPARRVGSRRWLPSIGRVFIVHGEAAAACIS